MSDRVQLGVSHVLWYRLATINTAFVIAVLTVTVVTTVVVGTTNFAWHSFTSSCFVPITFSVMLLLFWTSS